ncbi:class I SAM-dependent methyltransferase [Roseibium sediminicola]|uniref:Class I SAM-dependent methyltransferase n=1 Tax=Roseibium sediminicola TaxID=2933272 RepID=A0ABT0GXW5_9HYPH|nr:class I SAM-dependent methyltransferase [Roseibium sp. CAU 1639]MCK7614285.1 class I SAM-dependent methyltransferase [Roseibium sp. CAU 1639]
MTSIFETLSGIGVAAEDSREVYATATRDRDDVTVYRDSRSGVIYIDGFYGGDAVYEDGNYRDINLAKTGSRDFEITRDAERRAAAYMPFVCGRDIVDFGCGDGAFLRTVRERTASFCGVELQRDYVKALNGEGIVCHTSLDALDDSSLDTAVSFHVLEHLPEPLPILRDMLRVLKPGGTAVLEVPHANDFLLSKLDCTAFRKFTLWSQHLVLHTRDSLSRLLSAAGFEGIVIEGVQRYPLSNHLAWLSSKKPGGHKSALAAIDTAVLTEAYEAALNRIDATDTLVAIARKPV